MPEQLPFDRVLGLGSNSGAVASILYADITSPLFAQFHHTISATARDGQTSYRVRYRRSQDPSLKRLAVNGYGIELALKRTDYIVIDDRKSDDEEEAENPTGSAEPVHESLEDAEELADLKPLSSSELLGLGFKTTKYIMESENPLATLERVSQDFPKYSSFIAKKNVSYELIGEHMQNREVFLPAGYNVVWMNGQQVQSREMNAFSLLEQLRRERTVVGNLRKLGFKGSEAVSILSHPTIADSNENGDSQRYDYRDTREGGQVIIWLNDIERDKRYSEWPKHNGAVSACTWLLATKSDKRIAAATALAWPASASSTRHTQRRDPFRSF